MMIQIRNLALSLTTFGVTYCLLQSLSSYHLITTAGLIVLALLLSDLFIKFVWNSLPSATLSDLKERAVLITGCDTGFGNKLARQLHEKGVTVFAGCLFPNGEGAQRLKTDCLQNLHILQLDVTKEEHVNAAVDTVKKILNGKPLLSIVNNAGIFVVSELIYTSVEEQKKILEVNTFGVSRVTQAFLPLLKESHGRVVIVASAASRVSTFGMGAYTMSKCAVLAYAEILRREMLRWSVSVHTIEPFIYETEMANKETVLNKTRELFNRAPEQVRNKYSTEEDYMKSFEALYDDLLLVSQPRSKINEVTDCILNAAIGKYPKLQYCPGLLGKIITLLLMKAPREGLDLVIYFLVWRRLKKASKKKNM